MDNTTAIVIAFLSGIKSIKADRDSDLDDACMQGDIKLGMVVQTEPDEGNLLYKVSVAMISAEPHIVLDGRAFAPVDISELHMSKEVVPFDSASITYQGERFHTGAYGIISLFKEAMQDVIAMEQCGKVSLFGTDRFNDLEFRSRDVPSAPNIYHTDHDASKVWKQYLLDI